MQICNKRRALLTIVLYTAITATKKEQPTGLTLYWQPMHLSPIYPHIWGIAFRALSVCVLHVFLYAMHESNPETFSFTEMVRTVGVSIQIWGQAVALKTAHAKISMCTWQ